MSDKPILFSTPMIRALLAGRKTQTRRLLKSVRVFGGHETKSVTLRGDDLGRSLLEAAQFRSLGGDCMTWTARAFDYQAPVKRTHWNVHLPIGIGDHLWVRETWARLPKTAYALPKIIDPADLDMAAYYRADFYHSGKPLWRSPIHMPRWASRLTLIVTDVRVQPLLEISDEDAIAEGCPGTLGCNPDFPDEYDPAPAEEYRELWNRLHGADAWDKNPWVAAYTFKVHKCNIDQLQAAA